MKYYVVDSFTDKIFLGNPAGVCFLDYPIDKKIMQNIAAENNLAETAFVIRNGDDFDLRWFTPINEINLCGHATLAAAFIISNFIDIGKTKMKFDTLSGVLSVVRKNDLYEMDFPAWIISPIETTQLMKAAININIIETYLARDLILVVHSEDEVRNMVPNMDLLKKITESHGISVTAKGDTVDFVSRFFAPNMGIPEDHVTGSVHCELIPFWAKRLNKNIMTAKQLSKRGGILLCKYTGERVKIAGKAVLYMAGEINL